MSLPPWLSVSEEIRKDTAWQRVEVEGRLQGQKKDLFCHCAVDLHCAAPDAAPTLRCLEAFLWDERPVSVL